ncbi:MAG: hypothetical protein ABJC66_09070 [Gammaproteobacteria bacterium]
MPISTPRPPRAPATGAGEPPAEAGLWELDLWNGSVWYSDWFRHRLQWQPHTTHRRLEDLKAYLVPGGWELLLQGIRAHLERQEPLDIIVGIHLEGGRIETWRVRGTAERTAAGQPVYLAGNMIDTEESAALGGEPPAKP